MFTFFIDTIVAGALLFTSIPLLIGLCVYAEYKYDVGSIFLPEVRTSSSCNCLPPVTLGLRKLATHLEVVLFFGKKTFSATH